MPTSLPRSATALARAARVALLAVASIALAWAGDTAHGRTLEQIRALRTVSVCANPAALPYSSNDPKNPGFQLEIAQALADALGVQLKVEWMVPRRRVRELNCDLMMDNVSDPRLYEDKRLLSRPYQRSGVQLGLASDAGEVRTEDDLRGQRKVGVMINSVASVALGRRGVRTSPYAFQIDMLHDIGTELSAGAVSGPTLQYYILQHPEKGMRVVDLAQFEPDLGWSVAVGLRNADEALRSEIDRALERLLADGSIERIYARYGVRHVAP